MNYFLKIKKAYPPTRRGFLMVEVLVAVSIISVSILGAMAVTQKSVYISRQAVHANQATFLLEEGAEIVRILRDTNWSNVSGLTAGTIYYPIFTGGAWTLSTTPNTVGIFTRKVVISNVNRDNTTKDISITGTNDPLTKLFTITVFWSEGGVTITKTLQFYIIDIFS